MRPPKNPNPPGHDDCGPADAFTGRRNELRELRTAADRARAGTASVVLVQGAPGIGKTALVRRFLAELTGFTVLAGAAPPTKAPVAFDSLSRLLRLPRIPAQGRPAPGERLGMGERSGTAGGGSFASGPQALRRFLDSSPTPLLLFLDDAQWADGPSVRALVEAARPSGRLCVVLAARRTRTWDEETRRAVQLLPRLSLAELDEADAAALVGAVLGKAADSALTRHLVLRSGRHPQYLKSLLTSHDLTSPVQEPWPARLPAPVVHRQLRGLRRADTEALEALAVLGGTASVPTLGRVLGVSHCASLLDGLAHEEFVVRTSSPVPTVAIRHAVLRDALYDTLSSTRRRALHLAAAQAVDWRQGLTHKVAAAESANPALTADLLELVAHELGEGRLLTAARTLVSAARLTSADDHLADHLLYGAIRILFWAGADAEITQHATAVATRRPCAWRDEALGLTEFAAGRLTSARPLLQRAQEALRAHDPAQHAVVSTELAMVHAILGQGDATHQHAVEALRRAPEDGTGGGDDGGGATGPTPGPPSRSCARPGPCGGTPAVVVPPGTDRAARALSAYGAALRGSPRDGLALLDALSEDADRIGDEDLPVLTVRGLLRLADGQLATATTDLTMALVRARPGGARLLGSSAALHLAMCHLLTGDWDRAAREIDAALDDEQGRAFDAAALWSLRCVLEACRGDGRAADACLAQAEKLAQGLDFAGPQYHTAMARALNARARGDHRGVVAALQVLAHYAQHSERVRFVATSWLPFLAESLIVCGLADHARAAMSGPGAGADPSNLLLAVTDAWLHGRLAEAAEDGEEALRRYQEAIAALEPGRDVPLLRGLLETSCGRVSAAMGRTDVSARHFDAAEAVFTRLGAQAFLAECRTQRQAPFGTPGHDLLTEREREVARLVGLGHTNREIGEELRLSVKTIEYHLRSVFAKLAVPNRRELRRRVQAGGI